MRTLLYGIIGVGIALAFVLGLGCASATRQPIVLAEAGAPGLDGGAGAGDVVGMQEVPSAVEVQDGAAGATGGSDAVDAVTTDANGGDRINAEVAQEAPAPDVISGDWFFAFVSMTHGEMTLALAGKIVTGTYTAGPGVPKNGPGTILGSYDADVLTLTFAGTLAGTAMGTPVMQPDGTWLLNNVPAMLDGAAAQFYAKH